MTTHLGSSPYPHAEPQSSSPIHHAARLRSKAIDLREQSEQHLAEADRIERLVARFPGLRIRGGRWDKVVACAPGVGPLATGFETRFNCGCCNDAPLELWIYAQTPDGRVYVDASRLPYVHVGEKSSRHGVIQDWGWSSQLRDLGIPAPLISQIEAHVQRMQIEGEGDERSDAEED